MTAVIPDLSEWQGTPSLTGQPIVIIRGHNGYRADRSFAANRAAAHAAGCQAVGIYQYMLAVADPAQQAQALLATTGPLAANEWLVCDLEESVSNDNDEAPRYRAWQSVAATASPTTWLYTGSSFAEAHGLAGMVDWLADYQATEPALPAHKLWQFSSGYRWPWGQSDASLFHGTVDELAALLFPQPTPVPSPVAYTKDEFMRVVVSTPPGGKAGQYLIRTADVIHIPDVTCGTWAWNLYSGGAAEPEAVPWEVILWLNNGRSPI